VVGLFSSVESLKATVRSKTSTWFSCSWVAESVISIQNAAGMYPYSDHDHHPVLHNRVSVAWILAVVVGNGILGVVDLSDPEGDRFGKSLGARRCKVVWYLALEVVSERMRVGAGQWRR